MSEPDESQKELAPILDAFLEGERPANIALTHLIATANSEAEIRRALAPEGRSAKDREKLRDLAALLDRSPSVYRRVRDVLAEAATEPDGRAPEQVLRHWAGIFDRLSDREPEAGVALYALGSPAMLAAATDEVVEFLRIQGLLGPDRDMLDLGCGIGRFLRALAPEMRGLTGLDLSAGMVAEARRRCADLPNVRIEITDGTDLSAIGPGSVDLVLAADVFPYLVGAGGDLARRHVGEASRALRPGGALAIFNYSYRGDHDRDRADLREFCETSGLTLTRAGTRDFALWDAHTYLVRKPAGSGG